MYAIIYSTDKFILEVMRLPYCFIPILVMFLIMFTVLRRNNLVAARNAIKNRASEDKAQMLELAKKFIGKDSLLYSFDGSHFDGVVKDVADGAVLIEKNGSLEAINLDFVIRIREYPKNKKGKKKSVILD